MNLRISSRAPTRIDLAGGTLDLWPLYLFIANPLTINLGIDLYAEATLVQSSNPKQNDSQGHITLKSVDQKLELKLPWSAIISGEGPVIPPGLELHYKLLRHFLDKKQTKDFSKN